jgi:PhoPQ-activated pathogenicity-related protein
MKIRTFSGLCMRLVMAVALAWTALPAAANPLDDYVAAPDDAYAWNVVDTISGRGYKVHVVDLVSQKWRTEEEVDRTLWQHWLLVVVPDEVKHDGAMLFIGGGSNGREAPDKPDKMLIEFAMATNSVVAELKQVPNQPIRFPNETEGRHEDSLIAYTWEKFRDTGDPTWAARFPMTKAGVRAMDTVQALMKQEHQRDINRFVVAGGSKRGWTTWTVAAVDPRVCAIAPLVIDVLNVRPSMEHHLGAYGFWAPAIGSYVHENAMSWMYEPAFEELMRLVDPYSYRDRLTMPKYIVNGTGDQFFLPDSWQFYYHDLAGEKLMRYVPNADHGLKEGDVPESLAAWYSMILNNVERPEVPWTVEMEDERTAVIRVTPSVQPVKAVLWQAVNPLARDFRIESLGPKYEMKGDVARDETDGSYTVRVTAPEEGWNASLIELTFDVDAPRPLVVTSGVAVLPDILPFPTTH